MQARNIFSLTFIIYIFGSSGIEIATHLSIVKATTIQEQKGIQNMWERCKFYKHIENSLQSVVDENY